MPRRKPTCFVVMPFGKKVVGDIEIDFDLIFDRYIEKAGYAANYKTRRADTDKKGVLIIPKMMTDLRHADLVVADVTYFNPNVYYELGVRHSLRSNGTVVIRRKTGDLALRKLKWRARDEASPHAFDLQASGLPIHDYHLSESTLPKEIALLRDRIIGAAQNAETDSPVFYHLKSLRVTTGARPARRGDDRTYALVHAPGKYIGYRSGDIADLKGDDAVDFWVNSENTLMQMARMYERSVSSTIRYYGARDSNPKSPTFDDTIANALKEALGNRYSASRARCW
jgi:hypothetical protein